MATLVDNSVTEETEDNTEGAVSSAIQVTGGLGTSSYFHNSNYQRLAANVAKPKIEETIMAKLDMKAFSSSSKLIRLTDYGCGVGPNTFHAMQDMIEIVKKKYQSQCPDSKTPEFQVFFNDQSCNDFNTLFRSFPLEREYSVAGVPGSFHRRVFPAGFLHVAHLSYALHWLSELPKEVQDENSPAWNKGRIHYAGAPEEVRLAYAAKFEEDLENFLNARAEEIVPGGLMVIINTSIPDGMPYSLLATGMMHERMQSILEDMVEEGLVTQAQVDTFNLPLYACPPGEFQALVEKNGNFTVEIIGLTNPSPWLKGRIDMPVFVRHMKAAMAGIYNGHFPGEITDELFDRLVDKLEEINEEMAACYREGIQLFAVLQHK